MPGWWRRWEPGCLSVEGTVLSHTAQAGGERARLGGARQMDSRESGRLVGAESGGGISKQAGQPARAESARQVDSTADVRSVMRGRLGRYSQVGVAREMS